MRWRTRALSDDFPENEGLPASAKTAAAADAYHQRARLAEERLAEVLSAYRKLKTENEGYRDRITKNLDRRFEQQRERLLLRFIEILDNLDRALEAAEVSYAGNPLIEGLILVRTQLLQTLQEEGLERIPVVGRPYDPHLSEAVATEPVDDPDQHHLVLRDMLRGYRLNGRVVRASKVVVAEYQATEAAPAAPAEPPVSIAHEEELTLSGLGLETERPGPGRSGDEPESLEDLLGRRQDQAALFPAVFEPKKPEDPGGE